MKLKVVLLVFFSLFLIFSVSQIFSIPPYAGDIYPIYHSGYFSELDREFQIIKDAFLGIKMTTKPAYAWIYLQDQERHHDIKIRVYNYKGEWETAPGAITAGDDPLVPRLLTSRDPEVISEVRDKTYYSAIPLMQDIRCQFCHRHKYPNNVVGVITMERKFDASIYYSSERKIIFSVISLIISLVIVLIARWDPVRDVKELFDKKN